MNGESLNIRKLQLEKLRELFPEAVTEGKIDWEKLQATLGKENIEFMNERYVLNWAGKSDAFKILQQSTTATLKPIPEESYLTPNPSPAGEGSLNFIDSPIENVFIEGENLEVLKVLQKSYYGKVKVICIDPPYNTGNDSFIYPDSFKESKEDYKKRIGDVDEEGYLMKEGMFRRNSKDSGHYHSNWLSMMYPRLFLAKNLLRDDGVIFVHIDDNEVHNLRLIMNEIFGEENFVGCFIWRKKEGGGQTDEYFVTEHEYVIVFRKTEEFTWGDEEVDDDENNYKKQDETGKFKIIRLAKWGSGARKEDRPSMHFAIKSPDNSNVLPIAPDGNDGRWRVGKKRMDYIINNNLLHWENNNKHWIAYEKVYHDVTKSRKNKQRSILYDVANTGDGTNVLKDLFGVKDIFQNPKPKELVLSFVRNNSGEDDIILDFFSGSATTAQAVLELNQEDGGNRKFILVQLPEKCEEESEAYKAGYKTIADIGKERIRRVIKKITSPPTPLLEERGVSNNYFSNLFKDASPSIFENARQLRLIDKTEAETKLWDHIRNRKIENCKFRRQHPLGKFIADFYCHEKQLVVEVDGGYHNEKEQKEHDALRTEAINEFGISVIRFTNEEVLKNIKSVVEKISLALTSALTSTPSPKGEGKGEVGFKVFKLSPSNFKIWRGDEITEENLEAQLNAFTNPVKEGSEKENMLYELMLKAGYLLTDRVEYKNKLYYVNSVELIIALEEMNQELIDTIIATKPKKVITLDKLFADNDQFKTNTVLQMRDAEIDFKTI